MFQDVDYTRKRVLTSLFGHSNVRLLEWEQLSLTPTPPRELSKKKIASIGKKYPTIPSKYLIHYPRLSEEVKSIIARQAEDEEDLRDTKQRIGRKRKKSHSRKKLDELKPKKARVGRPKKVRPVNTKVTQEELFTSFFRKVMIYLSYCRFCVYFSKI